VLDNQEQAAQVAPGACYHNWWTTINTSGPNLSAMTS